MLADVVHGVEHQREAAAAGLEVRLGAGLQCEIAAAIRDREAQPASVAARRDPHVLA